MKSLKLFFLVLTLFQISFLGLAQEKGLEENQPQVYSPAILIDKLSNQVEETSGLIFFRNSIWTLNDSGGKPAIYRLDSKTGKVTQVVKIVNAINVDYEDLTQDNDFIYIGDFGNNSGNRRDLCIYKIAKNDIPEKENISVKSVRILFEYADQKNFQRKSYKNNYDCEAMLSIGDSLYLFTKNWSDEQTRVYALPKKAGKYRLKVLAEFPANGLITAAEYNSENGMLCLLGYKNYIPFIWTFWDFDKNNFFDGKKRRLNLESIKGAQTEGLCFNANGDVLISCENSKFPQRLFIVPEHALKSSKKQAENKPQPKSIDFIPAYNVNNKPEQVRMYAW